MEEYIKGLENSDEMMAEYETVKKVANNKYPAYKSGKLNVSEFSRVCDLSRTTIYKYISLLEA